MRESSRYSPFRGEGSGNYTRGPNRNGYKGGRPGRFPKGTPARFVGCQLPENLADLALFLGEGSKARGIHRALEYFAAPGRIPGVDFTTEEGIAAAIASLRTCRVENRARLQQALGTELEPKLPRNLRKLVPAYESLTEPPPTNVHDVPGYPEDGNKNPTLREPWDDLPSPIDVEQPTDQE